MTSKENKTRKSGKRRDKDDFYDIDTIRREQQREYEIKWLINDIEKLQQKKWRIENEIKAKTEEKELIIEQLHQR
jgi:hypothetical protein